MSFSTDNHVSAAYHRPLHWTMHLHALLRIIIPLSKRFGGSFWSLDGTVVEINWEHQSIVSVSVTLISFIYFAPFKVFFHNYRPVTLFSKRMEVTLIVRRCIGPYLTFGGLNPTLCIQTCIPVSRSVMEFIMPGLLDDLHWWTVKFYR